MCSKLIQAILGARLLPEPCVLGVIIIPGAYRLPEVRLLGSTLLLETYLLELLWLPEV